jgi:hypothetical protein
VILMFWMQSRADTSIAALRAMGEKKPNQPPEPTPPGEVAHL